MKHLVIRYSDKFGPTIELHNKVAEESGYVWFGKMGCTVADRWIRIFEAQISDGIDTWLYLVKREGSKYSFHKAKLLGVEKADRAPQTGIPDYYLSCQLTKQMSCFFRTEAFRRCSRQEVERIRLASSGSAVTETLSSSMAGLFIVEVGLY